MRHREQHLSRGWCGWIGADAPRVATLGMFLLQLAYSDAFVGDTSAVWLSREGSARTTSTAPRANNHRNHHSVISLSSVRGRARQRAATRLCVGAVDSGGEEEQHHRPRDWQDTSSAAAATAATIPTVNCGAIDPTVLPVVGDIRRGSVDTLCVRPRSDEAHAQAERDTPKGNFVDLFRGSAPYIRAHQGAVVVVHMGGEVLEDPNFLGLMDDLGLLHLLGVSARDG